jgi:hypothetical protein
MLPPAAVAVLASEGLAMQYLVELDLRGALLGAGGATVLCKAMLKACRDATTLAGGASAAFAAAAGAAAASARGRLYLVEKLGLRMNAIGPVGCGWVARVVAASPQLLELDLASNDLSDSCCGALAAALAKNAHSKLRRLDLSRNRFFGSAAGLQVETGALALVAALTTKKLRWLGPPEQLEFSVKIKRQLAQAMRAAEQRVGAGGSGLAHLDEAMPLILLEQRDKRLLQDMARQLPARRRRGPAALATGLAVACVTMPGELEGERWGGSVSWGAVDDATPARAVEVEWQASPPTSWAILRDSGGESSIVRESAADARSPRSPRMRLSPKSGSGGWQSYSVTLEGWRAGDELTLELAGGGPPVLVQGLRVRTSAAPRVIAAELAGITSTSASTTEDNNSNMNGLYPFAHGSGSCWLAHWHDEAEQQGHDTPFPVKARSGGPTALLQSRPWHTQVLLGAGEKGTSNFFTRMHDLYVHAGPRDGRLWLEWNVRFEGLDGRVLRGPHGALAGADWRIVKSGSGHAALEGAAGEGRLKEVEEAIRAATDVRAVAAAHAPKSALFACYAVDLHPLCLFVGDVLTLELRPATDALPPSTAHVVAKHRHSKVLTLHSSVLRLVQADCVGQQGPGQQPLAFHAYKHGAELPVRSDLAGARPFALINSPYSWA